VPYFGASAFPAKPCISRDGGRSRNVSVMPGSWGGLSLSRPSMRSNRSSKRSCVQSGGRPRRRLALPTASCSLATRCHRRTLKRRKLFQRALAANDHLRWIDLVNPAPVAASRYAAVLHQRPLHRSWPLESFFSDSAMPLASPPKKSRS